MRTLFNMIFAAQDTFRLLIGVVIILGMTTLMLPACQHDPGEPIEPDPMDTTGNPLDTMGTDTMDHDTMGTPCDSQVIYFNNEILPLLRSNCAKSGCHDAISHQEDIILDNYQNVMASGIVVPFDLNESKMFEAITENDPDKVMPEPPNQRLTADQITLIASWILQGAKDLECDPNAGQCITTNISYSTYIAPLIATNCAGCHSGPNASGNIVLTSHDGVKTVADNGRLLGAITWANGYQRMPKGSGQLSDCNIEKIKAWINDGAPNN
jgi:hypothetical protein